MSASLDHIKSSQELVTTYEATRDGFVALALEKSKRATPYLADARNLQAAVSVVDTPDELIDMPSIEDKILTAAGLSDKALKYFSQEAKQQAKQMLVENLLKPAGERFVEELVFRFLLVRGDTLGGSMRNIIGKLAQEKFTQAIIDTLIEKDVASCGVAYAKAKNWVTVNICKSDVDASSLRGLSWDYCGKKRTLIYNLTVPLVRKNVDMCLFNLVHCELERAKYKDTKSYIALGELKGGIDPAGADEHWKTARTSLDRIRKAFAGDSHPILTFFVGAAIEKEMSVEIWSQLQDGTLNNAANLNVKSQVSAVSKWLCCL